MRIGGTRTKPKVKKPFNFKKVPTPFNNLSRTLGKKNKNSRILEKINVLALQEKKNVEFNPIDFLGQAQTFMESISDKAEKALEFNNKAVYERLSIIALYIAQNVSANLEENRGKLKSEADELADLFESISLNGTPKADKMHDIFTGLMDNNDIYDDPLAYVQGVAEELQNFLEIYEDAVNTNSENAEISYSVFASSLAKAIQDGIKDAKEHLVKDYEARNKKRNVNSVNANTTRKSNGNGNANINMMNINNNRKNANKKPSNNGNNRNNTRKDSEPNVRELLGLFNAIKI